jgi:hypothetical protein
MRPGTLFESSQYKRFIGERDKALEQILQNAQLDTSRMLYESLTQIEGAAATLALHPAKNVQSLFSLAYSFEQRTLDIFSQLIYPLTGRIQRMRRATFTLASLGELEAIGRATQKTKPQNAHDFKQKLKRQESAPTMQDEALDQRVWLALMKLRDDVVGAFRLALIQKLEPIQILRKVKDSFPSIQSYRQPPRTLKPIREATHKVFDDGNGPKEISVDFVDPADWEDMKNAYIETELPPSRFDTDNLTDEEAQTLNYNWEIEQAMTDDFVQQVRDGQVDAANELGIQEFVWVAIIDNKTCVECCIPRNGMTTSEIEAALESGDLDADECDGSSPPIHPNCRCQLSPVASTDEVQGPDWKGFDEWLNS